MDRLARRNTSPHPKKKKLLAAREWRGSPGAAPLQPAPDTDALLAREETLLRGGTHEFACRYSSLNSALERAP